MNPVVILPYGDAPIHVAWWIAQRAFGDLPIERWPDCMRNLARVLREAYDQEQVPYPAWFAELDLHARDVEEDFLSPTALIHTRKSKRSKSERTVKSRAGRSA